MKTYQITASALINLIPEELFVELGDEHHVDYQVKKLFGLRIFKLLVYGLLSGKELSFRILEVLFDKPYFRKFAQVPEGLSTDHSSLAERLSFIKSDYFKSLFEHICSLMAQYFSPNQISSYKIIRFDSTLVALSSKLLKTNGMRNGMPSKKKEAAQLEVKFSVGFDGLNVKHAIFFNEQHELNENVALRELILASSMSSKEIAVFDRGLNKRKTFEEFTTREIQFVTRLSGNGKRKLKYKKVRDITDIPPDQPIQTETLSIEHDQEVHLYDEKTRKTKYTFRLITGTIKQTKERIYFLTNMMKLTAEEVTMVYKERWKIEVFFKFLKQEMNLKHFLSRNENGIQVMLYVTLITAMLIHIYRQMNKIEGYKIAKLKFINDLERDLLETIVELCKGDPKLLRQLDSS